MPHDNFQETEENLSTIFDRLFPLLRSITGPGTRESYRILQEFMPLETYRVETGTQVFDWKVPQEWHCEEAFLLDPDGQTVANIKDNNLHIVNYSEPIDSEMSLKDLEPHLYTIPQKPDAIPYVSSYYKKRWGFCLADRQKQTLKEGTYRAVIKSKFVDGAVDIAQTKLAGRSKKEIILSSYMCHPSLANNELSGPLTLLALYHRLKSWPKRNHTFRFTIQPETIGTLCMLHLFLDEIKENAVGGLILNMTGGERDHLTYKHSLFNDGIIDKSIRHAIANEMSLNSIEYDPNSGADERHYATPGVRVPVCNASRDFYPFGYEGYHNSMDTKEYMGIHQILNAAEDLERLLMIADNCVIYENTDLVGEPQLGPRGLYPSLNFVGQSKSDAEKEAASELCRIKWLLTLADGQHDLIDISERTGFAVHDLAKTAEKLKDKDLLTLKV